VSMADGPRRVLVTAGGSGIGFAMASAFAINGDRVWITDVDKAALAACPDGWNRDMVDASDPNGMASLFAEIDRQWGGIDIVCANAGISGPTAFVEDVDPEDFRRCVSVNLEGAFLAAKHSAPMMKRQNAGVLIFTSSTSGIFGNPARAPYVSAKWGIIGLMKTVAMELGPHGIRANAICPGCVEGPRIDGVIEREAKAKGTTPQFIREAYEQGVSMRSFVTAEDVAAMALFLASDNARMVSGQAIAIDGHTENPDPKV